MSNITNGNKLGRFVHSLVPRPPPFFVLRFAFSIIHGSRKRKKWERPEFIHHVSGCKVDVGGGGADIQMN